jgi:hypothetical protein
VIVSKSMSLISSILNSTDDLTVEIANKSADLLDEMLEIISSSTTLLSALLDQDKTPSLNQSVFV